MIESLSTTLLRRIKMLLKSIGITIKKSTLVKIFENHIIFIAQKFSLPPSNAYTHISSFRVGRRFFSERIYRAFRSISVRFRVQRRRLYNIMGRENFTDGPQ